MRSLLLLAFAVVGLLDCEQRFSSTPPPVAPESLAPAVTSGATGALVAPGRAGDAGPVPQDSSRAMTVTHCSASPQSCAALDANAEADASYRVVFGSGRAEIRSRGQAMADLYKELQDRTASGERLVAESRAPGDAGAPVVTRGGATPKADANASGGDALAQCAFHLLDLVDGVGEVTLDVVHAYGTHGCKVSLGRSGPDGGASRCLSE